MPSAVSASETHLASSWIPWVNAKASPISLFFHSLYYFGNEQVIIYVNKQNKTLANRHITPFLKSRVRYWGWTALKVGLQATFFLNRSIWLALNAVGLFFEIKKYLIKRPFGPLSLDAPVAFQNYVKCAQDPEAQRAFFAGLNSNEKADFCRWFAYYSPNEVSALLKLDYEHKIFDDLLYQQFLEDLVRRNSDVFACGLSILRKKINEENSFENQRAAKLQRAILQSLSLTSPSEKGPEIPPCKDFKLDERYLPALQLIFPLLANNDRARAARCCKLFCRLISNPDHTPPIQPQIKESIWIVLLLRPVPVDILSIGQIEVLFEKAASSENDSDKLPTLLAPMSNMERWEKTAHKISSISPERVSSCSLEESYAIYIRWKQGIIPEEEKKEAYNTYRGFIHFSQYFAETLDPLTLWILETGSPEDKLIVSELYKLVILDCLKSFLILMKKYLQRTPDDFKAYFFNNFQEMMQERAANFDQETALEQWRQKNTPLSWPEYLSEQISKRLERDGAEELFKFVLVELKKRNDEPTLTLYLHFLGSFRFLRVLE